LHRDGFGSTLTSRCGIHGLGLWDEIWEEWERIDRRYRKEESTSWDPEGRKDAGAGIQRYGTYLHMPPFRKIIMIRA
jgi:hypothetical protein